MRREVKKGRPAPARGPAKSPKKETSWGHVANWYHEHVSESGDTYHEKVIKPNLLRVLGDVQGKLILDVACGQGFFSRALAAKGARVTGVDIAPELIAIARQLGPADISYIAASASRMPLPDSSFNAALCVLALQNIKDLSGALAQVAHLLKKDGSFVIVLNHPCFRIPRHSEWGFDPDASVQFRRIDRYLSESSYAIQMHPGKNPDVTTLSYHRPLQLYMKELAKHGFVLAGLEEWISHRVSEKGPRAGAEDRARKEFPLFLMLNARKQ
ncbi:MAG: class I SAM-dependent methyltransferase [bacterium]|nr:class I SAM-dependent methyltransferase [bacterium]